MFNPDDALRQRAAATERVDDRWLRGEVHDPRAQRLAGVAGHAGLFSTAGDLVRYGQMMLGQGQTHPMILDTSTYQLMTQSRTTPRGTRTFAWDHRSPYSSNRGESFSDAAFGHGGFTGTVIWIDPEKQRVFVFLSSRLHPDGEGTVNPLAGRIATLVGTLQVD
jgi:CubicO group peptidase (beta-lactamase class C family)